MRAIDRLRKSANLVMSKRTVNLSDGSEFEFWCKPLTMAESERARKGTKDDTNAMALNLLLSKACDENGGRLFAPGDGPALKNEVRNDDLQELMLAILTEPEEEAEEQLDMKSTRKGA